jgi:hypothetical protein
MKESIAEMIARKKAVIEQMVETEEDNSSAKSSTSTESSDKANVESSEETKDKSNTESSMKTISKSNAESEISASIESNVKTVSETVLSANISAKTVSIEKRLKYLDLKEHRSYYIDKELLKKIDKINKKYNIDKSDIVNEALKLLFETLKI